MLLLHFILSFIKADRLFSFLLLVAAAGFLLAALFLCLRSLAIVSNVATWSPIRWKRGSAGGVEGGGWQQASEAVDCCDPIVATPCAADDGGWRLAIAGVPLSAAGLSARSMQPPGSMS